MTEERLGRPAIMNLSAGQLEPKEQLRQIEQLQQVEQLRQDETYREEDDRRVEEGVAEAVAQLLEDGEVLISSQFEFRGAGGGLHGLVAGCWDGMKVIVLVEAKHDMDSRWRQAQGESFNALKYWNVLKDLDVAECIRQEDMEIVADYVLLRVAEYSRRPTMLAFGGRKFSIDVVQKRFHKIPVPWFYAVATPTGEFVATPSEELLSS